jgi:hypothetical protein
LHSTDRVREEFLVIPNGGAGMACLLFCLFSSIDQAFSAEKRKRDTRNEMLYNKLLVGCVAVVDAVKLLITLFGVTKVKSA